MDSVSQEIKDIIELQVKAGYIQTNALGVSAQASEKMKQLRERIKGGETTGDKIKDFVIARYGLLNDEIEAIYRDLKTRVERHTGEFVLMVVKRESFHGCGGMGYSPTPEDYTLDEHIYLGVLKHGSLVLNPSDNKCEFQTGNYARCRDPWQENTDLVDGNIAPYWLPDFGYKLNKPLQRINPIARFRMRGDDPDLELEVKIGDPEVKAWFEKKRAKYYLMIFQKMAQLLGRPIAEPPELLAELQRRREVVTKQLTETIQKRDQLKRRIASIFEAIRHGVYSSDGISITACETEDDARVISMGPRQQLKKVEDKIKYQLKIALELGMANDQLISISIQQLCQEYEVTESLK